jgi:hypothetical protein
MSFMRSIIALSIACASLLATGTSHANTVFNAASCSRGSDGSGSCYGTFPGFLAADVTSWAQFESSPTGTTFLANFGSIYYGCTFPQDGSLDKVAANAFSASTEWFAVLWDSHGTCNWVNIYRGSSYGQ